MPADHPHCPVGGELSGCCLHDASLNNHTERMRRLPDVPVTRHRGRRAQHGYQAQATAHRPMPVTSHAPAGPADSAATAAMPVAAKLP